MFSRNTFKKLLIVPALGLGISMMSGDTADAAVLSSALNVTATVNAACTISTLPIAFLVYDVTAAAPTDATGTVTVNCSSGAPVYVTLDEGGHAGVGSTAAAPVRNMDAGTLTPLAYGLFQDASHGTVWGGTAGTAVATTGTGADQALTVYGRIPAGQAVASGAYADAVQATVNY
jgi:spore coat protein U-like protein